MAQPVYRDGAAHELEELEAECARLLEEEEALAASTRELSEEMATLRIRVREPITSSVDVTERREALERFDAALEAARVASAQRRSRRRVRVVLAAIGAAILVSGATSIASARRQGDTGNCRTGITCESEGRCAPALSTLVGFTSPGEEGGCVARATSHCQRSCYFYGRCGLGDDACVATSDADCEASQACQWRGACSKVGDRCAAASEADCEQSRACIWRHQCSVADGACVKGPAPLSDQ
jgi:hypothetical protein